jgi:hypothetical protein
MEAWPGDERGIIGGGSKARLTLGSSLNLSIATDDGQPGADRPRLDEAVEDIGVLASKAFRDFGCLTAKQEHGFISRGVERAAQDQFTPRDCGLGEGEVLAPPRLSPLDIIWADLVNQKVVQLTLHNHPFDWNGNCTLQLTGFERLEAR